MKRKRRTRTFTIECGRVEVTRDGQGKFRMKFTVFTDSGNKKVVNVTSMDRCDLAQVASVMWAAIREDRRDIEAEFNNVEGLMRGE